MVNTIGWNPISDQFNSHVTACSEHGPASYKRG
jgi:hypothetical protein